jgi:hypothetical protein
MKLNYDMTLIIAYTIFILHPLPFYEMRNYDRTLLYVIYILNI